MRCWGVLRKGTHRFSALLRLKQDRMIYSMISISPGIKEASSHHSSRLSHKGEWACEWGKGLIVLCLVSKRKSKGQFCVCIDWKLSLPLQRFYFIQCFSCWCFWFSVRGQLVILLGSLKNIHSKPGIVGYWIRTKADSIFGSTCLYDNNNNKSMQNIHSFSPALYQCQLVMYSTSLHVH